MRVQRSGALAASLWFIGSAVALGCSGAPGPDGDGDGDLGADAGSGGSAADDAGSGGTAAPASGGVGTGGSASGGSASGGATTGGTSSGGGSGGTTECVVTQPPSEHVTTLDATWDEMTGQLQDRGAGARPPSASVLEFTNTVLDQLFENDGALNYCVRYESTVTLSATQRDQLEAALERNWNEWFSKLEGHDCFPFDHVPVKVVGWAAMDRDTFDWDDGDHPGLFYIGDDSYEDAPQCAQACGRFFHRQADYQYAGCSGGRANHYDMSLWLTEGMSGGAGGDWGQRVGRGYFAGAIQSTTLHILSHEMGHGLGFPDYYNWSTWVPGVPAPPSIMVAGAAASVTTWDSWMVRRLWTELRADRL